jgi:hypothetical protein
MTSSSCPRFVLSTILRTLLECLHIRPRQKIIFNPSELNTPKWNLYRRRKHFAGLEESSGRVCQGLALTGASPAANHITHEVHAVFSGFFPLQEWPNPSIGS